jgi:prepilin-type N-terminal cleavage/methylation domain-containing protein
MTNIKQKGLTLLELTIVILITGFIAAGAVEMLRLGVEGQILAQKTQTLAWDGEIAIARLTDDLHTIKSPADIATATASALTFTNYNGATIAYRLSGGQLLRNSNPLANHVSSLAFTYFDSAGVTTATIANIRYIGVNLTLSDDVSYDFTTGVFVWGAS